MVLPELSRTMAYTTLITVNRRARKELYIYKSCGTRTIKGGINLYTELQKHKLDQIAARNMRNFSRKAYSFFEVKLRVPEEKYDTRDKNLSTVLANSSNHSRARRHSLECKPVSNTLTVFVIFCPSEANTSRLKTYLKIEMSQNNTLTLGKFPTYPIEQFGNRTQSNTNRSIAELNRT